MNKPPVPLAVYAEKPCDYFKDVQNARAIAIDDGIRELAQSLADHGYLQPVGAVDYGEYGETLYGHRRLAAHRYALGEGLAVPSAIPVLLYPSSITPTGRQIITATENLQRKDLTDPEIYRLCKTLMALNPDWQRQDLAAHLHKHPSTITHYLSPDGLIPEALQAFLDGRFGFTHAYAIRKSPDQAKALAKVLSGSSRAEVEDDNRRPRNGHGKTPPAGKPTRIRIPVATGGGAGAVALDLPEGGDLAAAEALLKEAKAAVALPQVKLSAAGDAAPATVTVARKSLDAQAATLLDAALEVVKDARARKLKLTPAMAEWQEILKAARAANATQARPDRPPQTGGTP